jgi:hypothetical protein
LKIKLQFELQFDNTLIFDTFQLHTSKLGQLFRLQGSSISTNFIEIDRNCITFLLKKCLIQITRHNVLYLYIEYNWIEYLRKQESIIKNLIRVVSKNHVVWSTIKIRK